MCTRKDRQYEDRDGECWWRVRAAGTRQPLERIGPRIRGCSGKEGGARCDVRSTITSIVSVGR
jgi:hypothetical protein